MWKQQNMNKRFTGLDKKLNNPLFVIFLLPQSYLQSLKMLSAVCSYLPVGGFQLRPKKSVVETESDALSCWCFLRHLWQTENHPGVDLSETELSHQAEPVHGPVRRTERQTCSVNVVVA